MLAARIILIGILANALGAGQDTAVFGADESTTKRYRDLSALVRPPKSVEPAGAWPRPQEARIAEVVQKLHDLCEATILAALQTPDATAASVRTALRDLQAESSLVGFYGSESLTNIPQAEMTQLHGLPVTVAAFAVLSGGHGVPEVDAAIQFYSKAGGQWTLQAEAGDPFDGTSFQMMSLDSPNPGEAWFLVWGKVIGGSRSLTPARLYAFDGHNARVVWQSDDRRGGSIKVLSQRELQFRYIEPRPQGIFFVPETQIIERWQVVPSGLLKIDSQSTPFK
ncbi:MAG: hypothetical protein GC160_00120 [Acidobacteria bacterium]|nr:hypothetical protein [Acidobacteriota bacterium]